MDQFGQVIDAYLSPRRDAKAARRFFERSGGPGSLRWRHHRTGTGSTPGVLDELLPAALHETESMQTTRWRLTTDGSKHDFDRCGSEAGVWRNWVTDSDGHERPEAHGPAGRRRVPSG